MVDIPDVYKDKGPVTNQLQVVSLLAQEDADEHAIVTFGTVNKSVRLADSTDFFLGYVPGKMVEDEMASVHLFAPLWKGLLDDNSGDVSYGDTLELADAGLLSLSVLNSGNTIAGKAMDEGSGGDYIQYIPTICCPEAAS